jgi:redox-sensitive bicupin YhaK (pirin superfamily)
MNKVIYKANERGAANHGWLNAKHTFSFAGYYDPEKIHFGALRVLNDDTVAPHMGFNTHPHDNMEIITIPLQGEITHKDSMGNEGTITAGEIQVMSAGTGIQHSEMNKSNEELKLFQIWIIPNKQNVEPRYAQIKIDQGGMRNEFQQLVSPSQEDAGVWIHQDAWIHMIEMDAFSEQEYKLNKKGNGIFVMNIEGELSVANENLLSRDAVGVTDTESVNLIAIENSKALIIEVPTHF